MCIPGLHAAIIFGLPGRPVPVATAHQTVSTAYTRARGSFPLASRWPSPVHAAKKDHHLRLGHGDVQAGQQTLQLLRVDAAIARHIEQLEEVAQLLLKNTPKERKSAKKVCMRVVARLMYLCTCAEWVL